MVNLELAVFRGDLPFEFLIRHNRTGRILFRGRLHFKVGEESKGEFLAREVRPFRPDERQAMKSYHEGPPSILDDQHAWLSRAGESIRVGANA